MIEVNRCERIIHWLPLKCMHPRRVNPLQVLHKLLPRYLLLLSHQLLLLKFLHLLAQEPFLILVLLALDLELMNLLLHVLNLSLLLFALFHEFCLLVVHILYSQPENPYHLLIIFVGLTLLLKLVVYLIYLLLPRLSPLLEFFFLLLLIKMLLLDEGNFLISQLLNFLILQELLYHKRLFK